MCKLVILFLIVFSHQYVYSQIETNFENATVEDTVTKLLENVSESDVLNLFNSLNNFYNYTTLENDTNGYENTSIKSSTVMKISPRTGRKYVEITTPPPEPESSTSSSNLEWIARPLREGFTDFKVKSQTNQACNLQSDLLEMHLKNNTMWAVRSKYEIAHSFLLIFVRSFR